jgi:hypothetical protein
MEVEKSGVTLQAMASAKDLKCEKCDHSFFVAVAAIKVVSALMSPSGQEMSVPVQTFACAKCQHVNEDFVPKFS